MAQTRWGEDRCSVNSVLIRKIKQREPPACRLVYLLNFSTWCLLGTENLARRTQNVDSAPPHPASPHVFPSQQTAPPAQLLQPDAPPWSPIPLPSSPTSSTAGPGQSQQGGCGLWPGSVSPLLPTPNLSSWSLFAVCQPDPTPGWRWSIHPRPVSRFPPAHGVSVLFKVPPVSGTEAWLQSEQTCGMRCVLK